MSTVIPSQEADNGISVTPDDVLLKSNVDLKDKTEFKDPAYIPSVGILGGKFYLEKQIFHITAAFLGQKEVLKKDIQQITNLEEIRLAAKKFGLELVGYFHADNYNNESNFNVSSLFTTELLPSIFLKVTLDFDIHQADKELLFSLSAILNHGKVHENEMFDYFNVSLETSSNQIDKFWIKKSIENKKIEFLKEKSRSSIMMIRNEISRLRRLKMNVQESISTKLHDLKNSLYDISDYEFSLSLGQLIRFSTEKQKFHDAANRNYEVMALLDSNFIEKGMNNKKQKISKTFKSKDPHPYTPTSYVPPFSRSFASMPLLHHAPLFHAPPLFGFGDFSNTNNSMISTSSMLFPNSAKFTFKDIPGSMNVQDSASFLNAKTV
ncbi:hypothetical protein ROZALSC1DRAFT_27246 [Rozella allomycis CSF55]|uniref:Uncharacterized protein n=1 Tax=Rozella allomycis (strain CSF55) TaxID=988480 RepID=A0A4P9YP19_ROZAC|nr:hypothetical protein ROZALSC1DRAFT_27246 [Rozella allomycis CSF55]